MTISVIITAYNLEKYIGLAIDSVLKQTIPANEIIVVDDGSSDSSVKVIENFGNKVKLIKMEKNSGVLLSFLAGLKASSGEILSFLDGDDIWMVQKLEKVIEVFKNHSDVMMITHLHEWIDKDGKRSNVIDDTHRNLERITQKAKDRYDLDRLLKNSLLCYKGVWLGSAFCIRRSYLDLNSYENWVLPMPGKELSHQDQPLAAYLIHTNSEKKIHLINEVLFQYRVYSTNSSGSSIDVKSAIKTVNRSIATVLRTMNIVEQNPSWREENYHQKMKLRELKFYLNLYTGKRLTALKGYFALFTNYWNRDEKIKEIKRLMICMLFGPERFLKMKTKRRFN